MTSPRQERRLSPRASRIAVLSAVVVVALVLAGLFLTTRDGGGAEPEGAAASEEGGRATVSPATTTNGSTSPTSPDASPPATVGTGGAATPAATPTDPEAGTPSPAGGGTPTIPGVPEDPASIPASRPLLCDVTRERLDSLAGPDGSAEADVDDLRRAGEVLVVTIPDWRDGAVGYPLADERLELVQIVSDSWERAVAASDAGDAAASRSFVDAADEALEELGRLEPLPGC